MTAPRPPMGDPWEQAGPRVGEVGEARLLEKVVRARAAAASLIVPNGDDAAVMAVTPGGRQVVTTDAFVEGVHFLRRWLTPAAVGARSVLASASDIAAMGATPRWLLSSMQLPDSLPYAAFAALAEGLDAEAARVGIGLIGGNLTTGNRLALHLTVIGELAPGAEPLRRDRARPGDLLWCSGPVGRAAMGRNLLDRGAVPAPIDVSVFDGSTPLAAAAMPGGAAPRAGALPVQSTLDEGHRPGADRRARVDDPFVRAWARPTPRWELVVALAATGERHAGLDISDGLLLDARRLARASEVAVLLDLDAILAADPDLAASAAHHGQDPRALILHGGEDYELLVAGSQLSPGDGWRRVGRVTPSASGRGEVTIRWRGAVRDAAATGGGWDPFTAPAKDRRRSRPASEIAVSHLDDEAARGQ